METTQSTINPPTLRLSGRAIFLVSGGIDSPVAASRLIRKGIDAIFLYFDSYPLCDKAAKEIALDSIRKVCSFHGVQSPKVYVIPHSPDLEEIVTKCPEKFACILSRRLMFRIAERIGLHEHCDYSNR